jgi:hypothetical protein
VPFALCQRNLFFFLFFLFGLLVFCEIHGPKIEFCDLGYCRYVKPNHVDVADFLQEVTTEEGIHFLLPEFRHLTSNEFVKAYMDSDMYKDVLRIVNNTQVIFIDPLLNKLFYNFCSCRIHFKFFNLHIHTLSPRSLSPELKMILWLAVYLLKGCRQ